MADPDSTTTSDGQRAEQLPNWLSDTIRLLCDLRPPKFHRERELALYRFQVWVLFPNRPALVRSARQLAAKKYIRNPLRKDIARNRNVSSKMISVMAETKFRRLSRISNTSWFQDFTPFEIDRCIASSINKDLLSFSLIDFRFRWREHKSIDFEKENITTRGFTIGTKLGQRRQLDLRAEEGRNSRQSRRPR